MAAESKTADDTIEDALELFRESEDGSSYNREAARQDIGFARLGDQWPDKVRKARESEGRPVLTINKLPAFGKQVVNDARQNKPGIKVVPVDNGADVNTAEVIGGLVRSVERGSNAEVAYDTGIEGAVYGGFGFFRIGIDYVHESSFEMEARIKRVPNPLMVHWDTDSTEFDASDWNYAFISDFLTEDQFEARYPKKKPVSFSEVDADTALHHWVDGDKIRIAEYWRREEVKAKLIGLSDGRALLESDIPKLMQSMLKAGGMDIGGQVKDDELIALFLQMQGVTVARERETIRHKVTRRIINGVEVLEEDLWPGTRIPICPVWGEEVFHEGRRYFRSLIRDARDPQTMFNFWRSATTELVALAPRAPWVLKAGSIPEGHEEAWATANTRSHAYLMYRGDTRPERQTFAGVPAGALQEALNASDDMKAVIGIYDASLGARSNETSGRAIQARQRESDNATFHFIDNLNRAIRYAGQVLVEIIPAVYSERQAVRILGEDSKEKVVQLTTQDGGAYRAAKDGEPELYNLNVGKYDVAVITGPSYQTQREEAREFLLEIMQRVPGAAAVIGDLAAERMDFIDSEKLAKRLQLILPPQIQAAEGITPPPMPMQPGAMPGQPMPGAPLVPPAQPGPVPQRGPAF